MATIKDVARLAGVSPTTVSIVINGKAPERKIPDDTCRRIEEAMTVLRYQPNMSARRLRSTDGSKPTIAFFWPMDYLIQSMAIIINELLNRLSMMDFPCEFVVQTYENDHIDKICGLLRRNEYHAAIIGCASQRDIDFIDSSSFGLPLIFLNRVSRKYPYVAVDLRHMVGCVAELFADKGRRRVGVLTSAQSHYASDRRVSFFLEACERRGIEVSPRHIITTPNSINDAMSSMERYLDMPDRPASLFCNSDLIALGALAACSRRGVKVPDDVEIISTCTMDPQFLEHSIPPLTTVSMPTREMCARMIELIVDALRQKNTLSAQEIFEAKLQLRESFAL